jgi:hypothetical protein
MRKVFLFIAFLLLAGTIAIAQDVVYIGKVTTNARACPKTTCKVIAKLKPGTPITVLETVEGTAVKKSTQWYRIQVKGVDAYVHVSLTTTTPPVSTQNVQPQPTPDTGVTQAAPPPEPATQAPPASSSASCPNMSATCSQLNCDQAYACLRAGNGRLDRDKDGVPCESVCPGG